MKEAPESVRVVRFGVFEVDLRSGELRKQGVKVKLQEQPFQVIAILLEHAGEVVTREELRRRLWPQNTFVDFEHSLATAINKVREALGDTVQSPRFIETLPKRGYRFIAPIEPFTSGASPDGQRGGKTGMATAAPMHGRNRIWAPPFRRWLVTSAVSALVVTLGILAVSRVAGLRDRLTALVGLRRSMPVPKITSIAVLPLENLSRNPDEDYFADGMTDELTATLAKVQSLRVISRTSVLQYRKTNKTLPQIARELNVDAILEGTVVHSGGRVRITAQLVYAPTGRVLWADNFESGERDVLVLQDELARAIADEIKIKLQPGEQGLLAGAKPIDPETHDDYLKGLFFYYRESSEDLPKAIQYTQRAIQLDPNYAQAYALLAACYYDSSEGRWGNVPNAEAARKAQATALKALELNDSLAEAHVVLGAVDDGYEWDWAGAEHEFKRAIALDPNLVQAHVGYAWHLTFMGRTDEAIQEVNRFVELDPVSEYAFHHQLLILFYNRHYDQAIKRADRGLEMFPEDSWMQHYLGSVYEEKGMYQQAVASWQKAMKLSGEQPSVVAALGHAYKAGGIRGVWRWQLGRELREGEKARLNEIAASYNLLGEKEKTFECLEKEYVRHDGQGLLFVKIDPRFDNLRSDPRFQNLMRRMNFQQ